MFESGDFWSRPVADAARKTPAHPAARTAPRPLHEAAAEIETAEHKQTNIITAFLKIPPVFRWEYAVSAAAAYMPIPTASSGSGHVSENAAFRAHMATMAVPERNMATAGADRHITARQKLAVSPCMLYMRLIAYIMVAVPATFRNAAASFHACGRFFFIANTPRTADTASGANARASWTLSPNAAQLWQTQTASAVNISIVPTI